MAVQVTVMGRVHLSQLLELMQLVLSSASEPRSVATHETSVLRAKGHVWVSILFGNLFIRERGRRSPEEEP